jgi:hypothetical protein
MKRDSCSWHAGFLAGLGLATFFLADKNGEAKALAMTS